MNQKPRIVRMDPTKLTVGLTQSGRYGITFTIADGAGVQVVMNEDLARKLAGSLAMLITESAPKPVRN